MRGPTESSPPPNPTEGCHLPRVPIVGATKCGPRLTILERGLRDDPFRGPYPGRKPVSFASGAFVRLTPVNAPPYDPLAR
jgi:hypothetical protein